MIDIIDLGLEFGPNHSPRVTTPDIVLHHSAGHATVQEMHDYHKNVNGWAGIGYHLVVDQDGLIYRGRPEEWRGAHTSGHNNCVGICAIGNFEEEEMSEAQKQGVIDAVRYIRKEYGPGRIYRHRDLDATACPGKNYPFKDIVNGATAPEPVAPAPAPAEKRYKTLEELPEYYRDEIGAYIDHGSLQGRGAENGLDLSEDMARILVICQREFGGGKNG